MTYFRRFLGDHKNTRVQYLWNLWACGHQICIVGAPDMDAE